MKLLICIVALLTLTGPIQATAESNQSAVGLTAPDFDALCADGSHFVLYEALKEKQLAVVCLFGSGCGACHKELRALEMAWRMYEDEVAVIGLSLDRTYDTDEVLLQFASELSLTFPLARDPLRTARFLGIHSYPAFMIVDREGTVVYVEVNGPGSADHFAELFDTFLGTASQAEVLCEGNSCPLPEEP